MESWDHYELGVEHMAIVHDPYSREIEIEDIHHKNDLSDEMDEIISPSGSISNSDKNAQSFTDCQICGQVGHGLHFGITTCRACAAFFRRTVVLERQFSCKKHNSGKCEISKNVRVLCKRCRYDKCVALGMTQDNVQRNRDSVFYTGKKTSKKNNSKEAKKPNMEEELEQDEAQENRLSKPPVASNSSPSKDVIHTMAKSKLPVTSAFDLIKMQSMLTDIFNRPRLENLSYSDRPTLKILEEALTKHRLFQSRNPVLVNNISLKEIVSYWEMALCRLGEWMMNCTGFLKLTNSEKLHLVRESWMNICRLERYQMTVDIYGSRTITENLVLIFDTCVVQMGKCAIDLSEITDCTHKDMGQMFSPFMFRDQESVVKPMIELAPTMTEIVYMLMQLMWHVEDMEVSKHTVEIADQVRARLSDELHHHYTYEMKLINYADRLMRIMAIAHALKGINEERRKIVDFCQLFDVFKVQFQGWDIPAD